MIELLNPTPQTVAPGQGVVYSEEISSKCSAERHRAGSAQLTLVKPGRYLVGFSGNVAIPAGGVVSCHCIRWGANHWISDASHSGGSI